MILILLLLLLLIIYYLLYHNYQYWKNKEIPGPTPTYFVGNAYDTILLKKSLGELYTDMYNKFHDSPCVGIFRAFSPVLIVRDPNLIKEILIQEFNSFNDNDVKVDMDRDPILGRNPFVLKEDEWKSVRSKLTPCFTSGKMKTIFPLLNDIGRDLVKFVDKQVGPLEVKELCTKITINNVASAAFGLEAKCFIEENSEFRKLCHDFLSPGGWLSTIILIASLFPKLLNILPLKFVPEKIETKLKDIVEQTLKYRKENNVVRHDFLNILNELKETSKNNEFTDIDVVAHAATFFIDGTETSSIIMSFFLYELGSNPEIQSKLRAEIQDKLEEHKEISYAMIQDMEYLDACFMENLRKNPGVFALRKICTKKYNYKGRFTIEEGTSVILPTYAIQHDPKYFESPEAFIPDRFLGENKEKIAKGTYFPFGDGPRVCLGQRFGILQIKTAIIHLLKNFEFYVNEKTQEPLTFDPMYFLMSPIGGLWINFKKI